MPISVLLTLKGPVAKITTSKLDIGKGGRGEVGLHLLSISEVLYLVVFSLVPSSPYFFFYTVNFQNLVKMQAKGTMRPMNLILDKEIKHLNFMQLPKGHAPEVLKDTSKQGQLACPQSADIAVRRHLYPEQPF